MKPVIATSFFLVFLLSLWALAMLSPGSNAPKCRYVTATAYNSVPEQTDSTPNITAFNWKIKPGDKIVAVSRDLYELDMKEGQRISIQGLGDDYRVADLMNKRWKNKIDIYMGNDIREAKAWGRRKVKVCLLPN